MRRNEQLACRDVVELLSELVDGQLAETVRDAVEAHLADCDDCAHFLQQVRESVQLTRALEGDSPEVSKAALITDLLRELGVDGGSCPP